MAFTDSGLLRHIMGCEVTTHAFHISQQVHESPRTKKTRKLRVFLSSRLEQSRHHPLGLDVGRLA
jgi:hypothetical protein